MNIKTGYELNQTIIEYYTREVTATSVINNKLIYGLWLGHTWPHYRWKHASRKEQRSVSVIVFCVQTDLALMPFMWLSDDSGTLRSLDFLLDSNVVWLSASSDSWSTSLDRTGLCPTNWSSLSISLIAWDRPRSGPATEGALPMWIGIRVKAKFNELN